MLKKGMNVKVLPYTRSRTIFLNSEVFPGSSKTFPGGWTGIITNIFDGTPGDDIIEVRRHGAIGDGGYQEFSPGELEILS
jgi:hypothetical protein